MEHRQQKPDAMHDDISVRQLRESDLDAADRIYRLAFGTFFGLPDPRRCERLPWIRKVIDNAHESEVLDWDYQEGDGTTKTYLWLKDHDFLVLMKRYDDGSRRLFTSFYVNYAHTRRTLEKKYSRRL